MSRPQRRSWHHEPDIANLSPDSFTAQKLVRHMSLSETMFTDLTATCDARASLPHVEALLHRTHSCT